MLTQLFGGSHDACIEEKNALNKEIQQLRDELNIANRRLEAIGASQATIVFELDGTIVSANDVFLDTMGYTLEDIQGQHHSIFVPKAERDTPKYQQLWHQLNNGKFINAEFMRVSKTGQSVWLQASYCPILDESGQPKRVVKYASDITEKKLASLTNDAILQAIDKSQAVIEFDPDGYILRVNELFLVAMGYQSDQVLGKHHSMFVSTEFAQSNEYRQFWGDLQQGKSFSDEFMRLGKDHKQVWIRATYSPVLDASGKVIRVVKVATDITRQKLLNDNYEGQVKAIGRSQAVIEFAVDGRILTANDNFLQTMGYQLNEIKGRHHSLFLPDGVASSSEYQQFWEKLASGHFAANEFKRINKEGQEVWIQATYNPILDDAGRVVKVVKFAVDITEQKLAAANYAGQIQAMQRSQAVVEFDLMGNITDANGIFLSTMGYSLEQIKGKHHAMFVSKADRASTDYKQFWQRLRAGEFFSGEFKRIRSDGREVWIQATYNPIFDMNGKPFKVVKFATDLTEQKLLAANYSGQIAAINRAQATIEFDLDGTILDANDNFLSVMGYSLDEIKGKHHALFVTSSDEVSAEYREFWANLRQGAFLSGEFKRVNKAGRDVWLQANYNPIYDLNGEPYKVVKYATDITQDKLKNADYLGQIEAISKSQAVIEFDLQGTILNANQNFLKTVGYRLDEIKGKHHSIFVEPKEAKSAEYRTFWDKLRQGKFQTAEYRRFRKDNKEVWIQASYNPIFDLNGNPVKIVKFATDITAQKQYNTYTSNQIAAISKAQAVIEFELDGTIIDANQNFLDAMGYSLEEIRNQHHSMFVEPGYRESAEYRDFWGKLARGESLSGEFKRIGRRGKEIWIQATYSPILDTNGVPYRVIKYATDVTDSNKQKEYVAAISASLLALSEGDLSQSINTPMEGEFAPLKQAMNATLNHLQQMVGEIVNSSQQVATTATELRSGTRNLSRRTEDQAAKLEETAAGVERLTDAVNKSAETAKEASQVSTQTTQLADTGGDVVDSAVQAMAEISKSSIKISNIIGVIDEIAFQTNLLALNASVEAARAGEQGRGFAVVAGEVRNLAKRSSEAAREIKDLIQDSVAKVEDGTRLVNESGDTFKQIVEAVQKVSALCRRIDQASEEQASGFNQVSSAILQMDTVTQQNASQAEEATTATNMMAEEARKLQDLVGFFDHHEEHEASNDYRRVQGWS